MTRQESEYVAFRLTIIALALGMALVAIVGD